LNDNSDDEPILIVFKCQMQVLTSFTRHWHVVGECCRPRHRWHVGK